MLDCKDLAGGTLDDPSIFYIVASKVPIRLAAAVTLKVSSPKQKKTYVRFHTSLTQRSCLVMVDKVSSAKLIELTPQSFSTSLTNEGVRAVSDLSHRGK